MPLRVEVPALAIATIAATLAACGTGDPTPPRDTLGTLRVVTTTTGQSLDPDGYTLEYGGAAAFPLPVSDVSYVFPLQSGSRPVRLEGVAPNCTVQGGAERTVTVPAGDTATTTFDVACVTLPGVVVVRTQTTGVSLDPDGYTVALDGGAPQPMGRDAAVRFGDVAPGTRIVALGGLADNCGTAGGAERGVTVAAGDSVEVTFAVTCADPGPPNMVVIRTVTSGDAPDGDGYLVQGLPGSAWSDTVRLAANDSIVLGPFATGAQVGATIADVAPECRPSVEQPVTVRDDRTVRLTVGARCWTVPSACRGTSPSGIWPGSASAGLTPTFTWTAGCRVYALRVFDVLVGTHWSVVAPDRPDVQPFASPVEYGVAPPGTVVLQPAVALQSLRSYGVQVELWFDGEAHVRTFGFMR